MLYLCPHKAHTDYRNFIIKPMNIQELLNRTDRFAANAGCKITEVDTEHAVAEMVVTTAHLPRHLHGLSQVRLYPINRK